MTWSLPCAPPTTGPRAASGDGPGDRDDWFDRGVQLVPLERLSLMSARAPTRPRCSFWTRRHRRYDRAATAASAARRGEPKQTRLAPPAASAVAFADEALGAFVGEHALAAYRQPRRSLGRPV